MSMIKLELKKNVKSRYFLISVVLLYIVFMLGDSGQVLNDGISKTTIIGAIWSKFHGNWNRGIDSSYLIRMNDIWIGNSYLPVLMPVICGLPGVGIYLEEMWTGNKRMMLVRCSNRQYHIAKIVANAAAAVGVCILSITLFYITLLLGYDNIPKSDEMFPYIYMNFSGREVTSVREISMLLVYRKLFKGVICFCLYAVINSSLCYLLAVWLRDKYIAFGGAIALLYVQTRIYEELTRKFLVEGDGVAQTLSSLINPCFLHTIGKYGFYQNRQCLALGVALALIGFHYAMAVYLAQKQFDITER